MEEKRFDKLVKMAEKRLLKEEYQPIHYFLTISGYSNEDIESVVSQALKNLTGCSQNMNILACILATTLLKVENLMEDDDFSDLDIDRAFKAAKLLFYEKAKTSTQALVLTKKEDE